MDYFSNFPAGDFYDFLIFLDIDGTIARDNSLDVSEEVLQKIQTLSVRNYVFLCTNNKNRARNEKMSDMCAVPCLSTDIRKPHKKLLDVAKQALPSGAMPRGRLVIGDKFLTDGLFAQNIGARFVKVKRIISKHDRLLAKWYYLVDDCISLFL